MTWENFDREEFACKCGCGGNEIQDSTIDVAQDIRSEVGFPCPITSGYRCPDHPSEAKKKATGTHPLGLGADIGVSGKKAVAVHAALVRHPRVTGIGVRQKGKRRFIHFDTAPEDLPHRPRPWLWSY